MICLRYLFRTIAVALVLASAASKAVAQTGVGVSLTVTTVSPKPVDPQPGSPLAYSAKFLCGTVPHDPANPQAPPPAFDMVPGTYLTSVNVHNRTFTTLDFIKKKALQILPEDVLPRGRVSQIVNDILGPDQGLQVDCRIIKNLIFPGSTFLPTDPLMEGFVVLLMPQDLLDVVDVITLKNVLPEPTPTTAAVAKAVRSSKR